MRVIWQQWNHSRHPFIIQFFVFSIHIAYISEFRHYSDYRRQNSLSLSLIHSLLMFYARSVQLFVDSGQLTCARHFFEFRTTTISSLFSLIFLSFAQTQLPFDIKSDITRTARQPQQMNSRVHKSLNSEKIFNIFFPFGSVCICSRLRGDVWKIRLVSALEVHPILISLVVKW